MNQSLEHVLKLLGRHTLGEASESNSRYLPRWQVSNRAKYALGDAGEVDECETRDLSCSGACVKISQLVHPGERIKLKIFLDRKNFVEVDGRVIWNKVNEEGRFAGISFDTASSDVQQNILDHAFELSPDEMVQHWFSGWDGKSWDPSNS